MKRLIVMAVVGCVAGSLMAADKVPVTNVQDIVVSATRIESDPQKVASSVTVINRRDIEARQDQTVVDVLRTTAPGLDVVQSGGVGGTASVFMRGAKSEDVLVLIDGIEVNDPSNAGRGFEWASLTVEDIERIEVLRGPQSPLYGSDAIGGVVNIITRKGDGPPEVTLSAEGGSFGTFSESASVNGSTNHLNYAASITHFETEGISSASEENGNTEKDGARNTTISSRLGWTPTEDHTLDVIVRYTDAFGEYDDFGMTGPIDAHSYGNTRNLFLRSQFDMKTMDGLWDQTIGVSLADSHRDDHTAMSDSSFDGLNQGVDWQNNLFISKKCTLTAGIDYQRESAESTYESLGWVDRFTTHHADLWGFYVQELLKPADNFSTALGARFDEHSQAGSEVTYRIAPLYEVMETGTRIKSTYGTGFKAPSLFQLYSSYGDKDLQPETSQGWDFGVEQDLCGKALMVGATYFYTHYDDMIDYNYTTYSYGNIAKARADGVETYAVWRPVTPLSIKVNYTYTDTQNEVTDEPLLRRARHKAGFDVGYDVTTRFHTHASVAYVGERHDEDFSTWPSSPVKLGDYTLVNLAASYDVNTQWQIFGRVTNLFDEQYEEVLGYGTQGIGAYAGIQTRF